MTGKELMIKRIQKSMRQKQLAKIMGITPAYVSMMENEKVKIPGDLYRHWLKVLEIKGA